MKHSDVRSDSASMPTGLMPASDAAVTAPPAPSLPTEAVSVRVEPVGPVLAAEAAPLRVGPAEPASIAAPLRAGPAEPASIAAPLRAGPVEGVLSMLCGARDVAALASRVPLGDAGCDALGDVIEVACRLRCAADAVVLSATAALEAARAGSGHSALVGRARLSRRSAKRTVESSEQVAQMPNVARGLAAGELNAEHAAVLADAARRTSPGVVDTAADLLEAAAVVSPETLREQAKAFAASHDPEAAQGELDTQRRARCASLFVDVSTGMGVLRAEFDPVSFALVRQALENYNDALWRLDGGRDATPGQVRDNRQRLADSLFEMVTDRNALVAIDHPAAHTPNTARRPQTDEGHDKHSDTGQSRDSDAGQSRDSDAGQSRDSDAGRGRNADHGHGGHSDAEHDGRSDHRHGQNAHVRDRTERPRGDRGGRSDDDGDGASDSPAGRSIDRWRPAQAPNQLIVIAEIGVIDGTKPDGLCEVLGAGPVPPTILESLSPDTRIRGALFDTSGEVLWLGRSRRLASAAQHLAVAIRDRGCVLCRAPMHRCRTHHIDEWKADNGTTDIPNLAAMCKKCHRELHNNNQQLHRHRATGAWTAKPRTHTANHATANHAAAANHSIAAAAAAATARAAGPLHTPRE